MQQLVGFAGQRFYVVLKVIEFFCLAAVGALVMLFLFRQGERSTPLSLLTLTALVLAGLLITLFVGMQSWLLKGPSFRLGFGTRWWAAPLAVGLAAAGSVVTFLLPFVLGVSRFTYVPAFLGWIGGVTLLAVFAVKDGLSAKAGWSAAQRRRSALEETSSDFEPQQLERIKITCDADVHLLPDNLLPSPKGRLLFFLAAKPWYDTADFPWASELARNSREILDEALSLMDGKGFSKYAYPGVNQGGWKSFPFVSQSKENAENLRRCPKTAALLQRIPRYPYFRDAMFSLLEPHRVIPPHQDFHNVYLTCHLGLRIPANTGIRVGGIERHWKEGECLIFDSSYSHTAYNHGNSNRLVLLVDFLHPDINEAELAWLQRVGLA